MKILLVLFLILSVDKELLLYRELLLQSDKSVEAAEAFYTRTKTVSSSSAKPAVVGYKAMSCFMMSKYITNPFTRLNYFKEGKGILEEAIKRDSANAELCYLRFSVQSNVPSYLNYSSNLAKDKKKVLNFVKNNSDDKDLKTRIFNFMLESTQVTVEEKNEMQKAVQPVK